MSRDGIAKIRVMFPALTGFLAILIDKADHFNSALKPLEAGSDFRPQIQQHLVMRQLWRAFNERGQHHGRGYELLSRATRAAMRHKLRWRKSPQ